MDWGRLATGIATSGLSEAAPLLDSTSDENNRFAQIDPNGDIARNAAAAQGFANTAGQQYRGLGAESGALRQQLGQIGNGQQSISAMQLRQGLQQNVAGQQAMAAGARPMNAAMAARGAAMNAGRMGSGLAGQQAMAGIQERQAANQTLGGMISQQRQQELDANLGARGLALQGYGGLEDARTQKFTGVAAQPTGWGRILGAGMGGAALAAKGGK